jgi:hypothetical protein
MRGALQQCSAPHFCKEWEKVVSDEAEQVPDERIKRETLTAQA